MPLQPVERMTLAQIVMRQIEEYIRDEDLKPGDALPSQHELAATLVVSRPVLREAMQGLASVGLIEIKPGSGCFVSAPGNALAEPFLVESLTHESALDVLEARTVIEVELAALAAERATEADFRRIEMTLEQIRLAIERGHSTARATFEFHQALADAAHQNVLSRVVELLRPSTLARGQRVEHALPDISAKEYESHRLLYDAVRSRHPERARVEMRRHLEIAHGWEEKVAALRGQLAQSSSN